AQGSRNGGERQRIGDRHADQEAREHGCQQHKDVHRAVLPLPRPAGGERSPPPGPYLACAGESQVEQNREFWSAIGGTAPHSIRFCSRFDSTERTPAVPHAIALAAGGGGGPRASVPVWRPPHPAALHGRSKAGANALMTIGERRKKRLGRP